MTPTIFLDLDGVLVDFVGGVMRWHGLAPKHRDEVDSWDGIPNVLSRLLGRPMSDADMWRTIEDVSFWRNLEWLPLGRQLYQDLAAIVPVVIMSTPCDHAASAAGKLDWIERELPPAQRREYALTPCKHRFARPGSILVDDSGRNCDEFRAAGGRAFLWPATWNRYARPAAQADVDRCVSVIASAFKGTRAA